MTVSIKNNATWTFSADGNGTGQALMHQRPLQFAASGTFGGGTVKLQSSPDGGTTWYDVTGISLTANGAKAPIYASQGEKLRAVLSGATAPTLVATISEVVV